MNWAMKYFDDWLRNKETGSEDKCVNLKPRGWKEGVISDFFALKDSKFMSRTSSRVSLNLQGDKLPLVMLCWALRLSLTFVGLQEIGESSSS